jgi:hypothetical protein
MGISPIDLPKLMTFKSDFSSIDDELLKNILDETN